MRRGVIVKTLRCCAELNCRGCPLEKLREGRGCTTKLAKEVLKQMQADDAERRKQYAQTLPKAIAIDFDGCLCQTHTRTSALQTGRLSSQQRQSKSPERASFSGRAERENCLRTRSKPAPDGACISMP
jgi:hypothetical protein